MSTITVMGYTFNKEKYHNEYKGDILKHAASKGFKLPDGATNPDLGITGEGYLELTAQNGGKGVKTNLLVTDVLAAIGIDLKRPEAGEQPDRYGGKAINSYQDIYPPSGSSGSTSQ
eukprot:TRINITY_DN112803_c0_g1_i1.p1 TRINITY_DN112803_c0_g1~~TRINITY_DN112803_c0_g1_i1.p1  ORF type:complete len:116 (-),score=22.58 TRINITY_DN112803_c0_g1_i1:152-499(-)